MFSIRYLSEKPLYATPGLHIRGIGIRETMPASRVERPRGSGDCLIMLFHAGVQLGPEAMARLHPPGTLALWGPGAAQYYGSDEARWAHSWVHCDGPDVVAALQHASLGQGEAVHLANPRRAERYLLDLHEEIGGGMVPDDLIVRNTLINLIREAARSQSAGVQPAVPPAMLQLREYLEAHYDRKLTLEQLAQRAHLSVPHLCAEFKRWFGEPPMTYVIRRRLETAALLLRGTPLEVGEIGRRVGYEDQYHFSRLFKQTYGVAPGHFRRGNP